jgi:hypothetical protein
MTPEESQIIRDIFARIRSAGPIPNDPQARAAINQEMIANPDAGIGLIQLLVGLDQQRAQLTQERDQLAAQLRNAGQSVGGGLFGNRAAPPPPPPPQAGPWGNQQYSAPPPPQQQPWGSQQPAAPQSSFLRTALGSAAGMAGGLFAFEAIRDVFGGHGGIFGGGYNNGGLFGGPGPSEYIVENNYIDSGTGGGGYDSSYDSGPDNSGGFDTSSDDSSSFGSDDSSFG